MTAGTTMRSRARVTPTWWVVARNESTELWFSAKGPTVLFAFSVLLALLSYLAASNAGINLLDARESVALIVKTCIGLGTVSALVISADAISGERERGTLEALLVTPARRRDIVLGKLMAATTMWAASLIVALPLVATLARGPGVAAEAVIVLLVAGSTVAAALTALGLAVSSLAMSNRVSLAVSITVLLLLAAPAQLAAVQANGRLGAVLIKANPVSAGLQLADNILVQRQAWADQWSLLVSPIAAAVLLTALAVSLASRLELGDAR